MKIKNFLEQYKTVIILCIIIFILTGLNIYAYTDKEEEPEIKIEEKKEEKPIKTLKIDLKGEINHPGIYEILDDKRINDIIEKAGGLTKNADTSLLNLSKKLKDEMVIIIYSKDEVKKLKENKTDTIGCPKVNDACTTTEKVDNLVQEKQTNKSENTNSKVSLNKATEQELQTLSGIGEAKAKAIIDYRNKTPFKTIEELKNISGIGDAIFEKIKNNITI